MKSKINTLQLHLQATVKVEHTDHSHTNGKKNCCGDCKGQGSCGRMTKVSFNPESGKDIATLK